MAPHPPARYDAGALVALAAALLQRAGLDADKARTVAEVLVEADLLGHDTHGLALLGFWLDEAEAGRLRGTGTPAVLSGTGAVATWDGNGLPGPWLVVQAADQASEAAAAHGIGAVAIRRSGHIGCLAAYGKRVANRGQVLLLLSSDPQMASLAPFGGTQRLFTPNPVGAGWPTPSGPVLVDVSLSETTNAMVRRHRAEDRPFGHDALLDGHGAPTRNADAFFADPPGSILPLGGTGTGHKGSALALLVETLTSALAGHGRADAPADPWRASVLVLVFDPRRFAGLDAFTRETGWMADAVHASPPVPGGSPVRLPGERALALRTQQLTQGVALPPSVPPMLAERAVRAGLAPLVPRSQAAESVP